MSKHHGHHARPRGVSLIELMIALAIGCLLVLGLVEVFAASRTAYQLSEGLARVQENGRFAIDYLQRDIRMAGHLGCVNDQSRFLPKNDEGIRASLFSTFLDAADQASNTYNPAYLPPYLHFDTAIEGYEANNSAPGSSLALTAVPTQDASTTGWTPELPATVAAALPNRVAGSDILVLRYFAPAEAKVDAFAPAADTATIAISNWKNLAAGVSDPGLFGIADCTNAAVFNASSIVVNAVDDTATIVVNKTGTVNRSGIPVNGAFRPHLTKVYRLETVIYYVGVNGTGQPALYRVRFNLPPGAVNTSPTSTPEELVEGIESMQLRYGQDSITDPLVAPSGNIGAARVAGALLPAANPTVAWRRVGLVQVGLLARSPNSAAASQRDAAATKLSALDVAMNPPDDRAYRDVYEVSIALRNRLFGQ